MRAADIMSTQLVSIAEEATVVEAIRLMLGKNISGLPVVDARGGPVGVITEGDLLRRTELGTERHHSAWIEFLRGPGRAAEDYVRTHTHRVADVMTPEPASVGEDAPLEDVVALMERRRIKRVLVVRDGRLVGLVSRADLLRALLADMEREAWEPACRSDEEIRERLLRALEAQGWAPREALRISCQGGVVTLDGVIMDEREREALRVAAERIPGVERVVDALVWMDPATGLAVDPADQAAPPGA